MTANTTTLSTRANEQGDVTITIVGRLDSTSTSSIWQKAMDALEEASSKSVVIDTTGVDYCDGTGIGLLVELHLRQRKVGGEL